MNERLEKQIKFLKEIDTMKNVFRRNLVADGSRRENDAEHSWHFAMAAMILSEHAFSDKIDISHVIKMALVHDLVEVYAGDTFAYDTQGYEDKEQREKEAADKLFAILPEEQGRDIRALWDEFDDGKTEEALYANAIDRFLPLLMNYLTEGHTWKGGTINSKMVYERMEPISRGIPALWEVVEYVIGDSIKKGYLKE